MKILKEVLKHEVLKTLGCTEPSAVALACSTASQAIFSKFRSDGLGKIKHDQIKSIDVVVNRGVLKNGMGVCIANAKGEKGNAMAAALGAICGNPNLGLEVLRDINQIFLDQAKEIIEKGKVKIQCHNEWNSLRIEAMVITDLGRGFAVIEGVHTNITEVRTNKELVAGYKTGNRRMVKSTPAYKKILSKMTIAELVSEAQMIDAEDRKYIKEGIDINLAISEVGLGLGGVSNQLKLMVESGIKADDIFSSTKIITSAATDARMRGVNMRVMSSGGSGNQGIVAILCPYNVGKKNGIKKDVIIESIALSHLINAYIKCFSGELAPTCGCAVAAGVGAAAAIVYQKKKDPQVISLAINNVIADIAGMLCDGAKSSCSLKVVSSVDSAIRSAIFALNGFGITVMDGIIGDTAEETIRNLGKVSKIGMANVDSVILEIMEKK